MAKRNQAAVESAERAAANLQVQNHALDMSVELLRQNIEDVEVRHDTAVEMLNAILSAVPDAAVSPQARVLRECVVKHFETSGWMPTQDVLQIRGLIYGYINSDKSKRTLESAEDVLARIGEIAGVAE